jgi:hypothetical protein
MNRLIRFSFMMVAVVAMLAIPGCDDADDITQPSNAEVQTDVSAGAAAVTLAGPGSVAAADFIGQMMGLLEDAPPAPGARVAEATCDPDFDLGNGLTGTCSVSLEGVVTFIFEGVVDVDGVSTVISGSLVAGPTDPQPETGSEYSIEYNAMVSNRLGSVTWSTLGWVLLDEAHQVIDFLYNMSQSVTAAGFGTFSVEILLTPTRFEVTLAGPLGNVLHIRLDRDTLSGTVEINDLLVAVITVSGGCTQVDFECACLGTAIVCPAD